MRAILMAVCVSCGLACGTPSGSDGGSGGGSGGSGGSGGAGGGSSGPVCLADRLDAGEDDGGVGTDFSCLGQPAGQGGQAELIITGRATRAGVAPRPALANVQLDLLDTSGAVLATAISDPDGGAYRLTVTDAGCMPVAGEIRATELGTDGGFYLSYAVPEAPWRYDRGGLELVMFDQFTRGLVAAVANVTLVNGDGVLAITVTDCAGKPVENATVRTANDAGVVRYVGPSGVPSNAFSATTANGLLVIFNLPPLPTDVIVTASDGGIISRRTVPIHPDAASGTVMRP